MKSPYEDYYGELIIGLIGIIAIIIQCIRYRREIKFRKEIFYIIFGGLIFLTVSALGNCMAEKRWDMSFLIDFLSLKKTGEWFFRTLALAGYLFIFCGATILITAFINRIKGSYPIRK